MRQHDVCGFEVAMDDARGMRGGQAGGDLARDARRFVDGDARARCAGAVSPS
jgi:hypothetical protein